MLAELYAAPWAAYPTLPTDFMMSLINFLSNYKEIFIINLNAFLLISYTLILTTYFRLKLMGFWGFGVLGLIEHTQA